MLAPPLGLSPAAARRTYDLHGVHLAVHSENPALLATLETRLRCFAAPDGRQDAELEFHYRFHGGSGSARPPARPSRKARPVYEPAGGTVLYEPHPDRLHLELADRLHLLCDPAAGRAICELGSAAPELVWPATHLWFILPLLEMLKRRGVFGVHAAGLSLDGRGLLIAGSSGAGKSTLALALLRARFGFLGDDLCFLAPGPDGLRVLAFPDEIDVAEDTIGMFPELRFLLDREVPPGACKRQFLAEEVYEVEFVRACRPAVVVFPRITATRESVLRPMDAAEALLELAPNVLLTEPRSAQAHLDALGALARQSACYRLETGRDFDTLPGRLAGLLL